MDSAEGKRKGRLKIFLGYAAGVGKTYQMLVESHNLLAEGHDVVVGYFESHGRKDTIALMDGLELIPRRAVEYRGHAFEEMDTDAILRRAPAICAVDEFPHTNVPGAERGKRWEDVMVLLDAGIDVLTTMNIQHLESLNNQMQEITGIQVRETIPDWVVKCADEVVLIDLPPQALLNRLQRGVVYGPEKAQRALDNFFKEPTLAALREMALRQTAHEVDLRHTDAMAAQAALAPSPAPSTTAEIPEVQERILIHITESTATASAIRRGRRVADYLKAECFAVCVVQGGQLEALPAAMREPIEQHLELARRLHIETRVLEGEDGAAAVVEFARRNGVTQLLLARPPKHTLPIFRRRHVSMRIVDLAKDMQVTVVAERGLPTPA
ncbi:MAG: histidine kinase [Bryobacteraceae bacterium]